MERPTTPAGRLRPLSAVLPKGCVRLCVCVCARTFPGDYICVYVRESDCLYYIIVQTYVGLSGTTREGPRCYTHVYPCICILNIIYFEYDIHKIHV